MFLKKKNYVKNAINVWKWFKTHLNNLKTKKKKIVDRIVYCANEMESKQFHNILLVGFMIYI